MRWLWAPPQYLTDQDWRIVPIGEHRVLVLVAAYTPTSATLCIRFGRPVTARSPHLGAEFGGPDHASTSPAAAARPTRTDEVLCRYVVTETSGQKVCNFFVCMTTMLSTSRGDLLTPSQQPVARSFARLRNEALKDLAERQ